MSVGQMARHRGVTLIEAVLYIAVALALIVGGLVFFQQASRAQKTSDAVRLGSALLSEARALYQTNKIDVNDQSLNLYPFIKPGQSATLVSAGSVPQQYVKRTTVPYPWPGAYTSHIINPWGGQVELFFSTTASVFADSTPYGYITLFMQGVPVEACARMVHSNVSSDKTNIKSVATNAFGGQIIGVAIANSKTNSLELPGSQTRNYSPSQAANACKYGSAAYGNTIGDYKGTAKPLSLVNIVWMFAL